MLLRPEDVARQMEQAFTADQPASMADTKEDQTGEGHPVPVASARGEEHIGSHQPQDLGVREFNMSPHGYVHPRAPDGQDLLKLVEEGAPPGEAQARIKDDVTPEEAEDEDEIWMKFVFDGDSAEISRKAFAQAREKTKQELLELVDPVDSDMAEAPSSSMPDMRSPVLRRHTPSRNLLEDPPRSSDPSPSSISGTGLATATTSVKPTMTSATSLAAEPGSSTTTTTRLHQPPPFVGRVASTAPPLKPPRSPNKRPRGRPRKKRDYRRPNIRTMPNYEADPITSESTDGTDQHNERS